MAILLLQCLALHLGWKPKRPHLFYVCRCWELCQWLATQIAKRNHLGDGRNFTLMLGVKTCIVSSYCLPLFGGAITAIQQNRLFGNGKKCCDCGPCETKSTASTAKSGYQARRQVHKLGSVNRKERQSAVNEPVPILSEVRLEQTSQNGLDISSRSGLNRGFPQPSNCLQFS